MNGVSEKRILWMSVIAAILFSVAGVTLGLLFDSQMILFDGLYSFISVGLSYISLAALKFMNQSDWEKYPFGKDMLEPIVILVKYTVILLLVTGSILAAAVSLFQGGRDFQVGPAFLYAAVSMAACLGVYVYLRKKSHTGSSLVRAEANQWMMDSLVSVGVFIGFLGALVLQRFGYQGIVPYIDPVMVMLVSLYFLKFPLKEMKNAWKEVLEMAPEDNVRERVQEKVAEIEKQHKIEESFIRISRVGRTIWVEIDLVAGSDPSLESLSVQDNVREKIAEVLEGTAPKKWLTVCFMKDRRWAVEE
ncbi:cation diffusion facilitator family transporter [Alkalicoccus daliensis]|uniref:Cation diffusion facilitator family transporter n=1 Tax=Alkalicoccus daliensis TaxID=745820 RepID=A0A1H0JNJ1_9BACI|nr:cation diffusion facilitator family transporter [Alkalicoccus daliensis]SDO45123.1 cation diffusion facilitator family transporter [Alkalicoccus daliensis]